jgi:hypothetical protein
VVLPLHENGARLCCTIHDSQLSIYKLKARCAVTDEFSRLEQDTGPLHQGKVVLALLPDADSSPGTLVGSITILLALTISWV